MKLSSATGGMGRGLLNMLLASIGEAPFCDMDGEAEIVYERRLGR